MDQIFIEDLLARGVIGVSELERSQPQDIIINVVIFTDTRKVGQTDAIEDTVNYRTVSKRILGLAEKAGRRTVEALAADIAAMVLEDAMVHKVKVRVEKPGAVRFSKSVGVEIERGREA